MAILDVAGKFFDVKPAFCRITSYESEELDTLDFRSIIPCWLLAYPAIPRYL